MSKEFKIEENNGILTCTGPGLPLYANWIRIDCTNQEQIEFSKDRLIRFLYAIFEEGKRERSREIFNLLTR